MTRRRSSKPSIPAAAWFYGQSFHQGRREAPAPTVYGSGNAQPAAAPDRYSVSVFDCAGEYRSTSCRDFEHATTVAASEARAFPGKVIRVINVDQADLGRGDGLTDEQRDQADASISKARALPVDATPVHAFEAAEQLTADARADREQFPDPLAHIRVELERQVAAERDDDPLTYRYLAEPCALCRGTRKGGDGYPCDGCEGTGLKECRAYGRHRPTVDFPLGAPRGRVLPTYEQAIALLRDWAADDGLDALPHGNGAVLREQLMLIAHAIELRSEADETRHEKNAADLDELAGELATTRVELQAAEAERDGCSLQDVLESAIAASLVPENEWLRPMRDGEPCHRRGTVGGVVR